MKFKNPTNDTHVEIVPFRVRLWALLFGPIYFVAKGLWVTAIIEIVLCLANLAEPSLLLTVWIMFALSADVLLARRYRRIGWVEEDAVKRKTPLIVWLLVLSLIPAFAYLAFFNAA